MDIIQQIKQSFVTALRNEEETSHFVQALIQTECQLSEKYQIISMESLIELNSQSVVQLRRITIALSILEKYTRHLLKPEELRSNMWKYVKFSNQIFKDRVDAIQGGRDLMKAMGYTKDIKDGLSFPVDGETDPEQLIQMLADIILGKQELNLYLTGSHPHCQYIDKLLPQNTIKELSEFQADLVGHINQGAINQPTIRPSNYKPEEPQPRTSPVQLSPLPSPSYRQSQESSQYAQVSVPKPATEPIYNAIPAVMPSGQLTQQPTAIVQQTPVNAGVQQIHNAQPSLRIDSNQIPVVAKLIASGKSISSISIEDQDRSSSTSTSVSTARQVTMSSGESQGMAVPAVPAVVQNVQSVQNTSVAPQFNSANDSMVQSSTEESVFPSGSACDICGTKQAEIICEICGNKQLCQGCDDKWHQHPRRQNHIRQNMGGIGDDQALSDQRKRSLSQGEKTLPPVISSSKNYGLNTQLGAGDDVYVTANFNQHQQGSVISHHMQNIGIEGYGRARTSSSGEIGVAEISTGVDPQSVQTGNWSSPQHIPYSYSHQTNVVRPVQTYGSPISHMHMSSSSPSIAAANQQFFTNHPVSVQLPNQNYMANQQLPRNQQLQGNPLLHAGHQMPAQQQSTAPGGPPTSRLLPSIVAVPDLQKRKSKLDINLMTLREEIEEVEAKINELISQNAQFFSDPEYASLYKRKGMLTREKMELEKYESDLDQALREEEQNSMTTRKGSLPDVLTQPVIYPPAYVSGTPSHIPSQPQLVNPSAGYVVYQYIPSTITPGGSLSPETQMAYSLIPAAPQLITQYPQSYRNQNMTSDFHGMYQSPPRTHNVRPQQPAAVPGRADNQSQQHQQYTTHRRSVEGKIENIAPVPVVKPQNKTHDALQIEERQNQQNVLKQSPPIPHRPSQVAKPHSYVNVPNLPSSYGDQTPPTAVKPAGRKTWICSHCTLHNNKDGPPYVCEVCSKTSTKPQYVDELESKMVDFKPEREITDDMEDETVVLEVGKHIGEVADQIYLEKIAAQKQYRERLETEKLQQAAIKSALPKPKLPDPVVTVVPKPDTPQYVESAHKLINRPKETVSGNIDTPPYSGGKISGSLPGKNFAETMEDIQRRKQQEEMAFEGKKLLMLLKNCEKDGVDADEVEIAVELSGELPVDKWLKEKWMPKVDRVIHMATNQGALLEQNDVGELSVAESKDALKINECDVQKAAKFCVENRRKLYKEIQKYGNFAREEVLQAMLHSQGDLESAVDEMNSKWLQLFYDRIWPSDDNIHQPVEEDPFVEEQQRLQENAIARATSEICNSVKNSVLSHTTFQTVIKDRNNDLERRIRLILVEGKLQSWGRAEIVIRILDEEVAQNKLDASLEEVVEAVKNCGDRSSSLVFLKQYCECCYSQFPMTKIRNLGCPCKICVQCVRQNFEVAIREKHVRNMNCPLCSQPNMEDMEAASDYLTFLSMLLQTMVSQEIMELYHSKLRDWHLQKDQNFRWCVHCGNGFIWTMGNQILRMVCPTCQRGTCFNCKKMWEDQHEGLTCEQFTQWKMDNDPENQTAGLARYLEDNGIDCPSCKMKYSLAKGGCMHFKCPQCGFEFCSGCSRPFYQKGVCRKFNSCRNKGFHCHHPRNCLYYLRDEEFEDLQTLLKNNKIQFNTTAPDQESGQTCPVMEQKEDPEGKRDEACGREVKEGFAGLCTIHFKEYLVSLINKRNLDPVAIMSVEAMKRLIEREEKKVPERKANESDAKYRKRLEQVIREIEPLTRQQ